MGNQLWLWDPTLRPLENKYDELVTQNKAPEAVSLVYNKVLEEFNKKIRTNNSEDPQEKLRRVHQVLCYTQ